MLEVENSGSSVAVSPLARWKYEFSIAFHYYLDRSAPHLVNRWIATLAAAVIYVFACSLWVGDSDEFRPFICRLPEFKFWYALTKAFCIAFLITFFSTFDVPIFWPILFFYWTFLFILTMKMQITHMIQYRYLPLDLGKQRYAGTSSAGSTSRSRKD